VDPLAEIAPDWTPYRYGFNNPLAYTDPDGMFESRKEARQWARDNGLRTGFFSNNKIRKVNDGSFAIENYMDGTSTSNLGEDLGVLTGFMYSDRDVMNSEVHEDGSYLATVYYRDGSEGTQQLVHILEFPDFGGKKGAAKSGIKKVRRPSFRKGIIERVWEKAKRKNGKVYDPDTGKVITWDKTKPRRGQWDMGHKEGREWWRQVRDFLSGKKTRKQLRDEYNDPSNYHPELPSSNRRKNKKI